MIKIQGPVLVGTDFSPASDEALRQGNDVANDLGTSVIVCHVVPDVDTVNVLFHNWLPVTQSTARRAPTRPWPRSSAKSRRT